MAKLVAHLKLQERDRSVAASGKLSDDATMMRTGELADAALGIAEAMGVQLFTMPPMDVCVDALRAEFERSGTEVDRECLRYVLEQRAGSSELGFFNTKLRRDCDESGEVLIERLTAEGRARRQRGEPAPAAGLGGGAPGCAEAGPSHSAAYEIVVLTTRRLRERVCRSTPASHPQILGGPIPWGSASTP